MKRQIVAIVCSVLALGTLGVINAGAQGKGRPSPAKRAEMMIKRGDKDGDGKLDVTELTALFEQMANRGKGGSKGSETPKTPKTPEPSAPETE